MSDRTLYLFQLRWPASWTEEFGRKARLEVEIGFGSGDFLSSIAMQKPHANIVGLDISLPYLRKAERRLVQRDIRNVLLVQSAAEAALWLLFPTASISALHINFPDPWPKAAHHKRRLIDKRFLHLAATRMRSDGNINLATDHDQYAQWIAEQFLGSPYFQSYSSQPYVTYDKERVQTKYERKALRNGRRCYYFKWLRNDLDAPNEFPIPLELPMPHVVLRIPISLQEIESRFVPQQWSYGTTTVRLIEVYSSLAREKLVADIYVDEQPADQRVLILIRQRSAGELLLQLHDTGFPRPTAGIHLAIFLLTEWLASLHPDARPVRHNLRLPERAKSLDPWAGDAGP